MRRICPNSIARRFCQSDSAGSPDPPTAYCPASGVRHWLGSRPDTAAMRNAWAASRVSGRRSHHVLACPRLTPNVGEAEEGERGTIRLRMVSPIWSVVAEWFELEVRQRCQQWNISEPSRVIAPQSTPGLPARLCAGAATCWAWGLVALISTSRRPDQPGRMFSPRDTCPPWG
jgi:hypothetical protein